jgi:hypothetical protein
VKPFIRATVSVAILCLLVLTATPAFAHEDRTVGDYGFVVGFAEEPVFAGTQNGVALTLFESDSGDPVVKDVDLDVDIGFGDESGKFPVEPEFVVDVFGDPGTYGAAFIPTRPGQYSFHFTGTIGDQEIDETFTSGPDTFDDVADPKSVSFPVRDPSIGEIAQRLDQEVPRLNAAIEDASDSADGNKALTIVALIAAGIALLLALASFLRSKGGA